MRLARTAATNVPLILVLAVATGVVACWRPMRASDRSTRPERHDGVIVSRNLFSTGEFSVETVNFMIPWTEYSDSSVWRC